jgi:hypothetical protein
VGEVNTGDKRAAFVKQAGNIDRRLKALDSSKDKLVSVLTRRMLQGEGEGTPGFPHREREAYFQFVRDNLDYYPNPDWTLVHEVGDRLPGLRAHMRELHERMVRASSKLVEQGVALGSGGAAEGGGALRTLKQDVGRLQKLSEGLLERGFALQSGDSGSLGEATFPSPLLQDFFSESSSRAERLLARLRDLESRLDSTQRARYDGEDEGTAQITSELMQKTMECYAGVEVRDVSPLKREMEAMKRDVLVAIEACKMHCGERGIRGGALPKGGLMGGGGGGGGVGGGGGGRAWSSPTMLTRTSSPASDCDPFAEWRERERRELAEKQAARSEALLKERRKTRVTTAAPSPSPAPAPAPAPGAQQLQQGSAPQPPIQPPAPPPQTSPQQPPSFNMFQQQGGSQALPPQQQGGILFPPQQQAGSLFPPQQQAGGLFPPQQQAGSLFPPPQPPQQVGGFPPAGGGFGNGLFTNNGGGFQNSFLPPQQQQQQQQQQQTKPKGRGNRR